LLIRTRSPAAAAHPPSLTDRLAAAPAGPPVVVTGLKGLTVEDGARPERPEPRLEMVRLVVPPSQGKQAEILGSGPEAARRPWSR
jgi:hypothetical protein